MVIYRQVSYFSLCRIFNAGVQPKVAKLYQPITYPVSRGTPMINSMIQWDHSMEWAVANFGNKSGRSGECVIEVDLSKEEDQYLAGHAIDGRVLFPATGYLVSFIATNTSYSYTYIFFYCLLDFSVENFC